MTLVFGSCIEPGGFELDNDRDEAECPVCHGKAIARTWEACEGGSINVYSNLRCTECNHFEGDTVEGGDCDHHLGAYESDRMDALYAELQADEAEWAASQIQTEQPHTDLAWLTKSDFLTFAAAARQAA